MTQPPGDPVPEVPAAIPLPLRRPSVREEHIDLLRAAVDPGAAGGLVATPGGFERAAPLRLAPAIAARALEAGVSGPALDPYLGQLRASTALWMVFEALLRRIGGALGEAGIPWLPIKGGDTATRYYPAPGERPASDLDVLVPEDALLDAVEVLETAGFRRRYPRTPASDDYYLREAHNLPLVAPGGHSLELHNRLWGIVPRGFTAEVIDGAGPAPDLGPTARRPAPHHELVLTAAHAWHTPRPRPLTQLLDLHRIKEAEPTILPGALFTTLRWQLQFPTGLALLDAAAFFGDQALHRLAAVLLDRLRPPEKAVLSRYLRRGDPGIPFPAVFLASLIAVRPRRRGLLGILRRLWPHPHVVAIETSPTLPPWRRRLTLLARTLRPRP